jgi:starvation-inducible DNA-binding protein
MNIDIGISEKERNEITLGLNRLLSDTYMLYQKTHYYHWNVTGSMFETLHLMFEIHYNELWLAVDLIAERIRALGNFAPGTYREFSEYASIPEDKDVPNAIDMIKNMVKGHEAVIKTIRSNFEAAEKARDQGTMDLYTQRLLIHEKTAWMLRSLVES